MTTKVQMRQKLIILPHHAEMIRAILDRTAGIWKDRRLNALNYQRRLRRQYETIQTKRSR